MALFSQHLNKNKMGKQTVDVFFCTWVVWFCH